MGPDLYNRLNGEKECCPTIGEVKEPGMFVEVADTIEVLMDISEQLHCFKREIGASYDPEPRGGINPTNFHESIRLVQALARGVASDLKEIMAQFR